MDKKIHKKINKDQDKPHHKEAVKGHRTRKHYIQHVRDSEAEDEIMETKIGNTEI